MSETTNGPDAKGDMPPRVARWTQKLLDLSLRNRLLNARETKELIPLACLDIAKLEDRLASSQSVQLKSGDLTDAFLVSKATQEETDKRLKWLFRAAKTDLEESGLNTLFLALGFLRWTPPQRDAKQCAAPLVLMPARLVRKSVSDIRLEALDEDTLVNPTLVELLRAEFRIQVKGVDPVPTDDNGVDVNAILSAFADAVKDRPGWEVVRDAALGRFSFGKFVMWKDLSSRLDSLMKNGLVAHLVSGGGAFDDGVEVFPPEEIAEHIDPTDLICPMSADSSQLAAVLYSRLGKTFVLHGPPGTGKSQTITNLIAHNLAHGRRVLFVSEKKAALDVVHNRLAKVGLKPFCLELHSNKSGKAEVLAQFREALEASVQPEGTERELVARQLAETGAALDGYVKALHKVHPNGVTAYDCFSRLISEQDGNPLPPNISTLVWRDTLAETREAKDAARETAVRLANDLAALDRAALAALAPAKDAEWTPEYERSLASAASDLASASKSGLFARLSAAFRNRALVPFGAAFRLTPAAADAIAAAVPGSRAVMRYRATRAVAAKKGLSSFAAKMESEPMSADEAARLFDRAHASRMLDQLLETEPSLAKFNGLDHRERIVRFRELDDRLSALAKSAALAKIADRMPLDLKGKATKASELGILRHECEKKMRHKPIRQLLREIPNLAPQLKPCFLMSPLSVAQYLPPDAPPFDLVVFDEASQIPVWDAIGVIARGRQLVVVGDPKQMPPTSFFQKGEGDDADDDEGAAVEDMESILDECLAAGVHSAHLNWHYRSRHESLIAFSNHNYYEDRLYTFPSANRSPTLGVRFEFVEGGTYDRRASRTNEKEARALVDYVFERVRSPGYRKRSVGVVTFSEAQRDLVESLFDERREKDPSIEGFFSEDAEEPFFVKNLENVQGDERDVILFSVGYAADKEGRLAMNFGPLNRVGGERRLNVAVTRAKEQVVVFSSIHGSQIDLSRTQAVGASHLRSFLEFAEKGSAAAQASAPVDNGAFPKAVAAFLRSKGYEVDEQVGTGACRIDVAVKRPGADGYLLAIECDGPSYAAQLTVRDRDQLRPSVLKGLGWKTVRLWSADWALDRKRAEGELLALVESLEM
ncbi:MAG: DUF4011 domain-containing protein [Kiritimatiellae bacterium]|nr:DUF4011 domain-containing protein [Kiritimatiellia bacterium]